MLITAISDTHMAHDITIPGGDVLIHAGDLTINGTRQELREALDFLRDQPHKWVVLCGGNHDVALEGMLKKERDELTRGLIYLEDSGVELGGVKFWGAPWQPRVVRFRPGLAHYWAFNLKRGAQMRHKWAAIPDDVDVLITHTPPRGTGDTSKGYKAGCSDLRARLLQVRPRLHVFGHVHHGYGHFSKGGIEYVNAAICDYMCRPVRKPIQVDYAALAKAA